MKIILQLLLILIFSLSANQYKVLNIVDGDTFDVDLNNDGVIQKKIERVRILGIDTFETKNKKKLLKQAKRFNISVDEAKILEIKEDLTEDCWLM